MSRCSYVGADAASQMIEAHAEVAAMFGLGLGGGSGCNAPPPPPSGGCDCGGGRRLEEERDGAPGSEAALREELRQERAKNAALEAEVLSLRRRLGEEVETEAGPEVEHGQPREAREEGREQRAAEQAAKAEREAMEPEDVARRRQQAEAPGGEAALVVRAAA
eukprot:SAG11_NODE_11411_length_762_cov_2.306184_2_plen_162_part_01